MKGYQPCTIQVVYGKGGTYASGLAGANVVGKANVVVGVAHEDGGLDCVESVAGKS